MNNKEKAIKAAYGDFWDKLSEEAKDFVLSNDGYVRYWHWSHFNMDFDFDLKTGGLYRPKSLSGIENNNSWIRIESEEDLPKEYKNYWCRTYNGDTKILRFDPEFKEWYYECNTGLSFTVTHYQPIDKPKPPIF